MIDKAFTIVFLEKKTEICPVHPCVRSDIIQRDAGYQIARYISVDPGLLLFYVCHVIVRDLRQRYEL